MKTTDFILKRWSDGLAALRGRIEREFTVFNHAQSHLLHLALNEAEALASQTDYATLVFPSLALEKVQNFTHWQARQELLRVFGAPMAFAA